jgi:Cdc6-like AAA superfamily ATPase
MTADPAPRDEDELRQEIKDYMNALGMAEPWDFERCAEAYTEQIIQLFARHQAAVAQDVNKAKSPQEGAFDLRFPTYHDKRDASSISDSNSINHTDSIADDAELERIRSEIALDSLIANLLHAHPEDDEFQGYFNEAKAALRQWRDRK